jgi:hypothetical protein
MKSFLPYLLLTTFADSRWLRGTDFTIQIVNETIPEEPDLRDWCWIFCE